MYRADLADSLSNLGVYSSRLGRAAEAISVQEEAVRIYRELAMEDPDRYKPGLATARSRLATTLKDTGQRRGAASIRTQIRSILPVIKSPDRARRPQHHDP